MINVCPRAELWSQFLWKSRQHTELVVFVLAVLFPYSSYKGQTDTVFDERFVVSSFSSGALIGFAAQDSIRFVGFTLLPDSSNTLLWMSVTYDPWSNQTISQNETISAQVANFRIGKDFMAHGQENIYFWTLCPYPPDPGVVSPSKLPKASSRALQHSTQPPSTCRSMGLLLDKVLWAYAPCTWLPGPPSASSWVALLSSRQKPCEFRVISVPQGWGQLLHLFSICYLAPLVSELRRDGAAKGDFSINVFPQAQCKGFLFAPWCCPTSTSKRRLHTAGSCSWTSNEE